MESTQVNIKGMVCSRCIYTIRENLHKAGMFIRDISLGKVAFCKPIAEIDKVKIRSILSDLGFELISDKKEKRLEEIKAFIHTWIEEGSGKDSDLSLSESLARHFIIHYDSLSELFSQMEGKSIEKYHIEKRLEAVKELLVYTDLSLSKIAFKKGFSSVHHLSTQFKKVTGLNPSHFREIQAAKAQVLNQNSMQNDAIHIGNYVTDNPEVDLNFAE
ncbi:AraC-type DNA-binding protein [Ekhidna lutea]|uniref:AraC-type DNA-binding protein n=1 Tax=Ekhidna lutea TaxID=447679 RepID=A0A239KIW8_EKHLU|nr:AraC family transcriptional regulator [Ekhidna lutea]SNT18111.1 AraC-type DNA-binding protein [Ekhidna lutea]